MADLITLEETEGILEDTGGVPVSYGGVSTFGHFEDTPTPFGDGSGVVASSPSVVIPSDALPGIGLDSNAGVARGIGQPITVGDYVWEVRAIEPGSSQGEIRVFLSNRSDG